MCKILSTIPLDDILREYVEGAYEEGRLGRNADLRDADRVVAQILAELEKSGVAMRYVNTQGQVAWKATPWLRDLIDDLQADVEAEFEAEDA